MFGRRRKVTVDMVSKETRIRSDALSKQINAAAIEVHRRLRPGLMESAYEACLCHELSLRGIAFQRQFPIPVEYKGIKLDNGYRIDVLVGDLVILELKAVEDLEAIHEAQLLTYLKLTNLWLGLLINFNVPLLKQGIRRFVNG